MNLSTEEQRALRLLVRALEDLNDLGAESVGRIADHVGKQGVEDSAVLDALAVECLRVVVDSFQ
jgi:hypothetical protein